MLDLKKTDLSFAYRKFVDKSLAVYFLLNSPIPPIKLCESQGGYMKLSGNLQAYYDALDELGIIDPLLKTDWSQLDTMRVLRFTDFEKLVRRMNRLDSTKERIKKELISYDAQMIQFFAMEVAKEFAEYHKDKQTH